MFERELLEAVLEVQRNGRSGVLATIIRDSGSVPRHAGSKMLVTVDGSTVGTIGGGEMESRVIAEALALLPTGQSKVMHYELIDPARGDPGLCGGQVELFLESIMPDPTVLVIGCGHCGQALADLAHWVGFRVVVSDDRSDLCNAYTIPLADEYLPISPAEIVEKATIHSRTYIAAVTRGVPLDVAMLPALLATGAPYIGVMGSRRRWATAVKQLREKGVDEKSLQRIHAPIGIELNAETPREIAVSIMAEILAHHYGGSGSPMQWMGSTEEAEVSSLPSQEL
jgi:xanthine dehydrogenase accessory factor